jgi:hypothetical protein
MMSPSLSPWNVLLVPNKVAAAEQNALIKIKGFCLTGLHPVKERVSPIAKQ